MVMTLKPSIWLKAFCYDWGDKIKNETGAVGDTKNRRFRSVSRIGKNAAISVLISEGSYFEGDKIVMDKQINTFWKNWK